MSDISKRWFYSEKEKYSPDLIDNFTWRDEDKLMPIAVKTRKTKGKDIPSTMIYNHYNESYPDPEVILGAFKLEYLTGETPNGKLRIYNLYDMHQIMYQDEESHMFVSDWIIEILFNSDVFIDVFLEHTVPSKGINLERMWEGYYDQGEMTKTIDKLEDCMFYRKYCPTPNIRVHGIDIRDRKTNVEKFKHILENVSTIRINDSTVQQFREFVDELLNSNIIKKQLIDTPECIKNKALEMSKIKFDNSIQDLKEYTITQILDEPNIYFSWTIGSVLIDIYLLGRLFRKFNIDSDKYMPENIQNAIIYTGGNHAKFYSEVLQACGFELKYSVGSLKLMEGGISANDSIKLRELNISDLNYPLFRD